MKKNKDYKKLKKIALDFVINNFDKIPERYLIGNNGKLTQQLLIKEIRSKNYKTSWIAIDWVITELLLYDSIDLVKDINEYWVKEYDNTYFKYVFKTEELTIVKPKYKMIRTLIYE